MSSDVVGRFLEALESDPALARALSESGLARGGTYWGPDLREFARANGYAFTLEDLQRALQQGGGELSEESLGTVAGGVVAQNPTGIYSISTGSYSLKLSAALNCLAARDCT